jgi:hypothetical protein
MEVLGLMVVIVLIVIGILFAIRFVIQAPASETKQEYTRSQLTSNLGIALLQSTTENCRGVDLTELLTDCAEFESITCGDGRRSCDYANDTIAFILNQTLDPWRVRYHIKAFVQPSFPIINFSTSGCHDNMPGNSETFFLPTDVGLLNVNVFICT